MPSGIATPFNGATAYMVTTPVPISSLPNPTIVAPPANQVILIG